MYIYLFIHLFIYLSFDHFLKLWIDFLFSIFLSICYWIITKLHLFSLIRSYSYFHFDIIFQI